MASDARSSVMGVLLRAVRAFNLFLCTRNGVQIGDGTGRGEHVSTFSTLPRPRWLLRSAEILRVLREWKVGVWLADSATNLR